MRRAATSTRRSTGLALLLSFVFAADALAAVAWSPAAPASPPDSEGGAQSLARTGGDTPYLHTVYVHTDPGTEQGVFYRRRLESGGAWSAPVRLSPVAKHAERPAIVASGSLVVVVWTTKRPGEVTMPDEQGRRLRRSFDRGSTWTASWKWGWIDPFYESMQDQHVLALRGLHLYEVVTSTRDGTANISLGSHDMDPCDDCGDVGFYVGTTTNTEGATGLSGRAAVALGDGLSIAWIADDLGTVKAVLPDGTRGTTPETTVTSDARDTKAGIGIAARGNRTAVAWSTGTAIKVRIYHGTTAGPVRTVATFSSGGTFKSGYRPTVALSGTNSIGVSWSECRRPDCAVLATSTSGVDVAWRESTDNGATWSPKITLRNSTTVASGRRNESPSVVWALPSKRHVIWTASSADRSDSRVLLRTGSGTP